MVQEVSTGKHNILLKEIADSVTSLAVLVDYSEHPKARITIGAETVDGVCLRWHQEFLRNKLQTLG